MSFFSRQVVTYQIDIHQQHKMPTITTPRLYVLLGFLLLSVSMTHSTESAQTNYHNDVTVPDQLIRHQQQQQQQKQPHQRNQAINQNDQHEQKQLQQLPREQFTQQTSQESSPQLPLNNHRPQEQQQQQKEQQQHPTSPPKQDQDYKPHPQKQLSPSRLSKRDNHNHNHNNNNNKNDQKPKELTPEVHDFLYGSGGYAKVFQLERKKPNNSKKPPKPKSRKTSSTKTGSRRTGTPKSGRKQTATSNSNQAFHDISTSSSGSISDNVETGRRGGAIGKKPSLSDQPSPIGSTNEKSRRDEVLISNELHPIFHGDYDYDYNDHDHSSHHHQQHLPRQQPKQMTPEELVRTYLGNEEYSRLLQLDGGGDDLTTQGNNPLFVNERLGDGDFKHDDVGIRRIVDNDDDDDDGNDNGNNKKGTDEINIDEHVYYPTYDDGEYYDDNNDDDGDDKNHLGDNNGDKNDAKGRKNGGWGNKVDTSPNNKSFETLFGKHFGNPDKGQGHHTSSAHDGDYNAYGSFASDGSVNDNDDDDDNGDDNGDNDDDDGDDDDDDDNISTNSYLSILDLGSPGVLNLHCPESCVCQDTFVDCSGQNFTSVPDGIGSTTTSLDLGMNNLQRVTEDSFAHLPHLEHLSIVGSNLTRLPKKVFRYNTLLRQINLQGNKLEKVPSRAFQNLQYLLQLDLDANEIKSVPPNAFKGLYRVQSLRLDANELEHIPTEAMRDLTGLQAFSFVKNRIRTVPAYAFQNNTQLITIILSSNDIEVIEDNAFYGLTKLKFLYLDRNLIRDIPTSFSHLPSLEELHLQKNRLSHLPDKSFQFKTHLRELHLQMNPIKSIGDRVFSHLPALEALVLSEVHDLVRFPDLTGTNRLKKVQLDRANIKALPKDLCRNLPNMTTFDVHSNKIGTIPNMSLCTHLYNLNMANNELTSLDGQLFIGLSSLHDLTLSNNFIHSIPAKAFTGLSALQYLNLAENQITFIHDNAFVPLTSLTDLNLGENHIADLPTKGLIQLQKLKVFHNKELKEFPPKESFPNVTQFVMSYAYHCCDFIHPAPELPNTRDFWENLTVLTTHPDARVSDFLMSLHLNFSKEQLKLYENMTIDKNHDLLLRIYNDKEYEGAEPGSFFNGNYDYDLLPMDGQQLENDTRTGISSMVDDHHVSYDQEIEVDTPRRRVSCRPKPGPFMPCDDLFGWWSLRCGVWVVFLLALLGNFVVFFVSVTSRSKMDVPRFLICNLALADFFMGIYLGMLAIVDASTLGQFKKYAIQWQLSPGCLVAGFLGVFSSELSVFTLTVITLERFYAITHAMQLNKRLSLKHSSVIMLCGWLFCFGIAVMPLFGVSDYRKFAICLPFEIEDLFSKGYVCFIMTFNGIAFFIILSCYLIMYISIRDSQAWNSNETRVAKRMALLVFTDFMCWAPVALLSLAAAFGKHLIHLNEAKVLTIFILPLNSCANPFLYAFFTKQFKKDCVLFCRRLEDSSIARHFSQMSQRHVSVSWKCQRRQSGLNSLMGDGKSQNSQNNSNVSNSYGLVNNYNSEVSSGTNKDMGNVKDAKVVTSWVKDVKTAVRTTPPKGGGNAITYTLSTPGGNNMFCNGRYLGGSSGISKDEYKYSPCPNTDTIEDDDIAGGGADVIRCTEGGQMASRPVSSTYDNSLSLRRISDAQVTLHEDPTNRSSRPRHSAERSSHNGRCNHVECSNHPINQRTISSSAQNNPKRQMMVMDNNDYGIISDEESSVWKKMTSQTTEDVTLTSSNTLPASPLNRSKVGSVDGYYSVDRPKHSPQRETVDMQKQENTQIRSPISLTLTNDPNKAITCSSGNAQQLQQQSNILDTSHCSTASSKHGKRRKNIHCCSANSSPVDRHDYQFAPTEQPTSTKHKKRVQGIPGKPNIQYVMTSPDGKDLDRVTTGDKIDAVGDEKMAQVLKCFSSRPENDSRAGTLFLDNLGNTVVKGDNYGYPRLDKFDDSNTPVVANVMNGEPQGNPYLDKNQSPSNTAAGCTDHKQSATSNSSSCSSRRKHCRDKDKSDTTSSHAKHKPAKQNRKETENAAHQEHNPKSVPVLTREFLHHNRTVDKSVHLRYFQQSIQGHDFLCKYNSLVELKPSQLEETRSGKLQSPRSNTLAGSTKRSSLTSSSNDDCNYPMLDGEEEVGDNLTQSYNNHNHHHIQHLKHHQNEQQQYHHHPQHYHNHHHHNHRHHNHHHPYCSNCSSINRQSSSGEVGDEALICDSRCDSLEMENYSGEQTSISLEEDFYNNSTATPDFLEGFGGYRNVSSADWQRAKRDEIGGLLADDSDSTDEFDGKNDSMSSTRHSADKESGFHSQI